MDQSQNQTSSKFSKNELRRRSRSYFFRQCRIIVRNLSYTITENKLRKEFERFGKLEEVNILKREDGKVVGCAFLQYSKREETDKAVAEMNNKLYMGRKIEVHYAKDKSDYSRLKREQIKSEQIKEEDVVKLEDDEGVEIKDEDEDDDDDDDGEDEEDDDDDDDNEEDEMDEDNDENEEDEDIKPPKLLKSKKKKDLHNEVAEGREVFVKNLPYEVEADELKELMSHFGIVEKVLINKERISGHSKGTAFVIFKLKDSAQLSCRQSLKMKVRDQHVEILPALGKKEIMNREKAKQEKRVKDSRNLYLLKEGVIMAGSPAAKGVSQADMAQRLRLEQRSNEILKNFNRFVARDRLTIHNIPETYTNADLRNMIINFTSHKPRECRVMRDNKPSFGNATGRSRGYGFVSFVKHEIALEVLRKLNNNPGVFGKNNRPIVSFSIEDRNVYNIKQKRMEKSRLNNPTYQKKIEELKEKKLKRLQTRKEAKRQTLEQLAVAPNALLQKLNHKAKQAALVPKKKQRQRDIEQMVTPFSGELSKEGKLGLRSNRKITHQADAHLNRIKRERKEEKKQQRKEEHARNRIAKQGTKRVKPKMNVNELKKEDAFFNEAIGKYKNMISQVTKQPIRIGVRERSGQILDSTCQCGIAQLRLLQLLPCRTERIVRRKLIAWRQGRSGGIRMTLDDCT
uniref:RRM domain-containing protein n=1 Tax=Anopheles christyi TaxID=43041 RepID=A0A182JRA9_9DIPT